MQANVGFPPYRFFLFDNAIVSKEFEENGNLMKKTVFPLSYFETNDISYIKKKCRIENDKIDIIIHDDKVIFISTLNNMNTFLKSVPPYIIPNFEALPIEEKNAVLHDFDTTEQLTNEDKKILHYLYDKINSAFPDLCLLRKARYNLLKSDILKEVNDYARQSNNLSYFEKMRRLQEVSKNLITLAQQTVSGTNFMWAGAFLIFAKPEKLAQNLHNHIDASLNSQAILGMIPLSLDRLLNAIINKEISITELKKADRIGEMQMQFVEEASLTNFNALNLTDDATSKLTTQYTQEDILIGTIWDYVKQQYDIKEPLYMDDDPNINEQSIKNVIKCLIEDRNELQDKNIELVTDAVYKRYCNEFGVKVNQSSTLNF